MTHFDKLFTASVTCIELNRCEPRELCTQVCTTCLANARWACDHHAAKVVHTIFTRLLEVGFQAARPGGRTSVSWLCRMGMKDVEKSPVVEPLLKLLDLPLVTANLFECLRGISIGPKLHLRVYCLGPVAVSII